MNNPNHDPDDLSARDYHASQPRPGHFRTLRITPYTMRTLQPIEAGGKVCVRNESGVEIQIEAGTLCGGMARRIAELEAERDEARAVCHAIRRAMAGQGDVPMPLNLARAIASAMILSVGLDDPP